MAGAWAEKSPVVVISGAPGLDERGERPLLHHSSASGRRSTRSSRRCARRPPRSASPTPPSGRSTASSTSASGRSGRCTSSCRATWSTSCPTRSAPTSRRPGRATRRRSRRR
ncbi:MAG: hypothetical protein ACK56I_08330 [bacterium]